MLKIKTKNTPENKLLYILYLFIAVILVLLGYFMYPVINKENIELAEEEIFSETHVGPSETKEGWVTYTNKNLKYRISFPENSSYPNENREQYFGVKNFIPIEDFYEKKLDAFYFSSNDYLGEESMLTELGIEVYPSDQVLISRIKNNIANKSIEQEADQQTKEIFDSAFAGITRDDVFAEGVTTHPFRVGGISRTKYLFISRYGNIYVLMFTTTYFPQRFEKNLESMEKSVNPFFKAVLNTFEYGI